jgi:hypothetical protein
MTDRMGNDVHGRSSGTAIMLATALAMTVMACSSSVPPKPPAGPLVQGEPTWPDDVMREAERSDRICNKRVTTLKFDQDQAKKEKEKFKTVLGSMTGAVGTVGGAIGGVGAFVIDSPDTLKTLAGVTGIVTAGLGAAGSLVTLFVSPGEEKLKSTTASLEAIDKKREAGRDLLTKKNPSEWTEEDKAAWAKLQQELADLCK